MCSPGQALFSPHTASPLRPGSVTAACPADLGSTGEPRPEEADKAGAHVHVCKHDMVLRACCQCAGYWGCCSPPSQDMVLLQSPPSQKKMMLQSPAPAELAKVQCSLPSSCVLQHRSSHLPSSQGSPQLLGTAQQPPPHQTASLSAHRVPGQCRR